MVFPDEEGPYSLERSTLIIRILPSTFISTFFMGYPSNVRSRSAGIRILLPSYRRRCLSSKLAVRPSWPSTAAIGMFAPSFAFPRDMGCYARLFPFAQVVALVPIIIIPLFFVVPAILFFGLWSPFSPDTALHRCSHPPSVSQPYPLVSEADWCPRQRKVLAIGAEPERHRRVCTERREQELCCRAHLRLPARPRADGVSLR